MNTDLLFTAPDEAIPKAETKAHKFLSMLSSGKPVAKQSLLIEFGEPMRSPLQRLEREAFCFWNIKRVSIDDEAYLQLDARHLSRDWELDKLARLERRRELAGESYTQAVKEADRKEQAQQELLISEIEYRTFLCELENRGDDETKCPKCGFVQLLDDFFHDGCVKCSFNEKENAQQKPSV